MNSLVSNALKIICAFLISVAALIGLTACGSSAASDKKEIEIVESGYCVADGYVQYGLKLHNLSQSSSAEFPTISISGKDADGKVVFSDEWVINTLTPDSTTMWASQAGNGNVDESVQVEFSISVNSKNWVSGKKTEGDIYTISNINEVPAYGTYETVTGEITLNKEGKDYTRPQIVFIFRDDAGNIVYGASTYLFSDLSVGTPKAFESYTFKNVKHSTVEVYANPWY